MKSFCCANEKDGSLSSHSIHTDRIIFHRNFDKSLRMRDPDWGVRDLERVVEEAEACGMILNEKIEMPANNLSVIYVKD